MDMYVQVLKPVPGDSGYERSKVYDGIELERYWGKCEEDEYHVRLFVRGRYVAMGDVKEYLSRLHPDWDMDSWSMEQRPNADGTDCCVTACCGINRHIIASAVEAGLMKVHVDDGIYVDPVAEFDLQEYDPGHISRKLYGVLKEHQYITDELIQAVSYAIHREVGYLSGEELFEELGDQCSGGKVKYWDFIEFLRLVKIYADKVGGAGVLYFA